MHRSCTSTVHCFPVDNYEMGLFLFFIAVGRKGGWGAFANESDNIFICLRVLSVSAGNW